MSEKKKISQADWLKKLSPEEFRDVFADWYIPAIQHALWRLEKKIEEKEKE